MCTHVPVHAPLHTQTHMHKRVHKCNPPARIHTHTHMYMHTHVRSPTRAQTCTWSSVSVHTTPPHAPLHIRARMNTCTYKPTSARAHVCTCTYVHTHTYVVTHMCKHTHACAWSSVCTRVHVHTHVRPPRQPHHRHPALAAAPMGAHQGPPRTPCPLQLPSPPGCPQLFGDTLTSLSQWPNPAGPQHPYWGGSGPAAWGHLGGEDNLGGCPQQEELSPPTWDVPWVVTATVDVGPGSDTEWLLPPWVVQRAQFSLTQRCGPSLVLHSWHLAWGLPRGDGDPHNDPMGRMEDTGGHVKASPTWCHEALEVAAWLLLLPPRCPLAAWQIQRLAQLVRRIPRPQGPVVA